MDKASWPAHHGGMPDARHPAIAAFLARHPEIRWIDAFVPDQTGYGYGKRVPVSALDQVVAKGLQMSSSVFVLDHRHHGHDAGGIGWRDGDPDMHARPLLDTLAPMPWLDVPTAQLMFEARDAEGRPLWHDPRAILAGVVQRLQGDGLHPVVACELEFYLVDGSREADGAIRPPLIGRSGAPLAHPANAASLAGDEAALFLDRVTATAALQRVPLGIAYAEYGLGQFELTLEHHGDPVRAADEAVMLKRIVRGTARSLGWDATFMARPYADQPGSGFHVHMSLTDADGSNLFAADEGLLIAAIGGMKAMLPETLALFMPNANSFKRAGGEFAPVNAGWGHDNRTVAFRVPAATGAARRIEHRVAGADANPYLVLAAILAAAHHGITERLDPGPPAVGHAGFEPDLDLPADVFSAVRRLETGARVATFLPPRYPSLYAALKRGEHAEFLAAVSPRELGFFW